jgi:hypothetical protein
MAHDSAQDCGRVHGPISSGSVLTLAGGRGGLNCLLDDGAAGVVPAVRRPGTVPADLR